MSVAAWLEGEWAKSGPNTTMEALMRARIARSLVIVWLFAAASALLMASTALADSRCSGTKGYQVYEDINYGGRSAITCGINRPDYTAWGDNLNFWENWNDRVSSAVSFNAAGWDVYFYRNANYSTAILILEGTDYVSDFRNWNANDQASSSKWY